ncbi:MAG: hypothetical protein ABFR32_00075 [Bacteroidota bacterium]
MRIILAILSLLFITCKSQHIDSDKFVNEKKVFTLYENCPDNGNCNIEILPDSELEVKQDEFGNLYPNIKIGNKLIIKYHYKRTPIENTADSNYSEIIYFELNNDKINLDLQNEKLNEVKLLFGRLCYCKGATGYYKVSKGDLQVKMSQKNLTINLQFEVKKIPQIIHAINESIILN